MSRKYSVLFVALAFVVAMAVGAWASMEIPSYSGTKDQTNTPNATGVDVVLASADIFGQTGFTAEPISYDQGLTSVWDLALSLDKNEAWGWAPDSARWVFSTDNGGVSADLVLAYVGRGNRWVDYRISKDAVQSVDFAYSKKAFAFTDGTYAFELDGTETSADERFVFGISPCDDGKCNFLHDVLVLTSDDKATSADTHIYAYVPCGLFDKEWQVFPHNMQVHPWDMVRLGENLSSTQNVDLGYYVVEKSGFSATGDVEALVERVLNRNGQVAMADSGFFDFLPFGESAPGQNGFRTISADAKYFGDVAYLQYEEWVKSRVSNDWFSWINTRDADLYNITFKNADETVSSWAVTASVDLAPSFARYYGVSADFTNTNVTETIDMCFVDDADDGLLCQHVLIDPEVWSKDHVCSFISADANCWYAWPMSADSRAVANLNAFLSMDETPDYVVGATNCSGTCEGYWDLSFETWNWNLDASCGTVCQAVSFDAQMKAATCNDDTLDVMLLKLSVQLRPFRVCDSQTVTDITAALAELADPVNKPLNVGPADAFLNNGKGFNGTYGHNVQIVLQDNDGNNYDMAKVAQEASWIDPSKDYQGVKNFFEVWAANNEWNFTPETVKEAWDADDAGHLVNLSFYIAVINADAPEGTNNLTAQKGYFVYYAGAAKNYLTKVATVTNFDPTCGTTPTPTPVVPQMTVSSSPSGSTEATECATFTKESFGTDAWTAILAALEITDESAYTFSLSGVDCLDSTTSGLTAAQDVTFTVTYEDGVAAAGDAVTGRMVFVYNATDSVYDVLPEAAAEVSIATEQVKTAVIAEASAYDQAAAADTLKVGFSLVSVVATPVNTPTTVPSGGGSSGCSFGFAPLALVLLAPLALLKK